MKALTNWSINSKAKILHTIRSQEYIHWFYGLRECEMHLFRCEVELYQANQERSKLIAQAEKTTGSMSAFLDVIKHLFRPQKAFASQQSKLSGLKTSIEFAEISIRDSQMQLDTAQEEYDRIKEENRDRLHSSYEELQLIYSVEALDRQHALIIAGRVLATQKRLPADVGELIMTMHPRKRDRLITEALVAVNNFELNEVRQNIADQIHALPLIGEIAND